MRNWIGNARTADIEPAQCRGLQTPTTIHAGLTAFDPKEDP
jgi:hypothetical protein